MLHLLLTLGTTALGEIVKKIREEPEPELIELKLGKIADRNLPETIPAFSNPRMSLKDGISGGD